MRRTFLRLAAFAACLCALLLRQLGGRLACSTLMLFGHG